MYFNLRKARESLNLTTAEVAEGMGVQEVVYRKYERNGEVPSKYVYTAWTKIKGYPIPDDFFYFTSFALLVNMKYHKLSQAQLAEMFDYANQSTISSFIQENIPMYEKKDCFLRYFHPLIVPYVVKNFERSPMPEEMTDLAAKGNLGIAITRRRMKRERAEADFFKKMEEELSEGTGETQS